MRIYVVSRFQVYKQCFAQFFFTHNWGTHPLICQECKWLTIFTQIPRWDFPCWRNFLIQGYFPFQWLVNVGLTPIADNFKELPQFKIVVQLIPLQKPIFFPADIDPEITPQ